ncbi:MAG TPA: class I SAM-dependent methyltransferase [Syntrophomonas sp.]|nr:class I SAM-dependent methyltransferase [Syntrophomonas sp.]
MELIVTTTQAKKEDDADLQAFLAESGLRFVHRDGGLAKLAEKHGAGGVIVWGGDVPVLYFEDEKLYFHPSMAKNRIAFYRKQQRPDIMIEAAGLERGDSFLDCTLGLGADAIVASYFSSTGRVTGLEHQPEIAYIIRWGMKRYRNEMTWLQAAVRRVEVKAADHKEFLPGLANDAYDIVYFDPMFIHPIYKSQPISPLRKLADHDRLELSSIEQACRVARKRVVMKDLAEGEELERMGFRIVRRSRYNKLAYGVIDV